MGQVSLSDMSGQTILGVLQKEAPMEGGLWKQALLV